MPDPSTPSVRPRPRKRRPAAEEAPKANGHVPIAAPQNGYVNDQLDPFQDRLAPSSIEAEKSVLGSILIDDSSIERIAALVEPQHFYRAQHADIYGAMLALHREATPIDLVTLSDELQRLGRLDAIGGPAYLASLMNAVPTAVHAEAYARTVATKALARRAIESAGRIAAMGYEDSNDPDLLVERLRATVDGLAASWTGSTGSAIERLGARLLTTIPAEQPPDMLIGRLDPLGHTILYGTGGVGKGTLSSSWVVGLLEDQKRILIVDYENHPDEWSRRIHGLGGGALMANVLHVAPLTAAWRGKRGSLWVQAADLRQLALAFRADAMVVDSLVPACGGTDALKPEAAAQYAGGLEYIGLPTLSLAHVTKEHDLRYPFGSVFWHNLARTTWSLKQVGGSVLLTHRKHNNYAKLPRQQIEVSWNEAGTPVSVWERSHSEALAQRISYLLGAQQLTAGQIVDLLNEDLDEDEEPAKTNSVRVALSRGLKTKPPKFTKTGSGSSEKWANAS